jgi:hypothetical protein
MWGSPDAIGNQQEFEITQKFRFPGYYFARSSMQKVNSDRVRSWLEEDKKRYSVQS